MNVTTIEQSEKLFHEFLEIAPEGITIVDVATLTFIKSNTNACKLLGFSPEEILTKGPIDLSPEYQPDGRRSDEKAKELIMKALQGEKTVFEWLTLKASGETFMAEVRLATLSGYSSPTLYASFVDITERVENMKKIQDQNRRLSEIAFQQSHEMRRPIANILGLISLFNFENPIDPMNAELLLKLKTITTAFDGIVREIILMSSQG